MEKLLSIRNLKKYFPVAKSSLFQKEKMYVRANEDISIDIYEGETFGLVASPAAASPPWGGFCSSFTTRRRAVPCTMAAPWRISPPSM